MQEIPDNLPLKTKLEMARGALGSPTTPEQAQAQDYMARLGYLFAGERELNALGATARSSKIVVVYDKGLHIEVWIHGPARGDTFRFEVPFDGFPSDTLKAQIILLLG